MHRRPLGRDGRYRPKYRPNHRLELEAQLTDIIRDEPEEHHTTTPMGDSRKLRGIPALSRGVSGAISGSRPGDNLT